MEKEKTRENRLSYNKVTACLFTDIIIITFLNELYIFRISYNDGSFIILFLPILLVFFEKCVSVLQ